MTDRYARLMASIVGNGDPEGVRERLAILRGCLDDAAEKLSFRFGPAAGELLRAAVEDVEDALPLGGDGGGRG